MRRRLFIIASAVSLGLCMRSMAMCARSYWVADDLAHSRYWRDEHIDVEFATQVRPGRLYAIHA